MKAGKLCNLILSAGHSLFLDAIQAAVFGQPILVILRDSEADSLDFTPASPVNFMFKVFLKYLSLSDFPQIAEVQVVFISFLTNVVVCSFTYLY